LKQVIFFGVSYFFFLIVVIIFTDEPTPCNARYAPFHSLLWASIEKTRIPPHIWPLVQPASLAVVYLDLRMDPMLSTLIACCVCVCVSKPTYSLSFIFFLFQCKHVR
jgi:hypothetical protein